MALITIHIYGTFLEIEENRLFKHRKRMVEKKMPGLSKNLGTLFGCPSFRIFIPKLPMLSIICQ